MKTPNKSLIISGVKNARRSQKVTRAASLGDRSENADYQYNKKRLREIDRRVRYLSLKCMENLKIVDYSPAAGRQKSFLAHGWRIKTTMA